MSKSKNVPRKAREHQKYHTKAGLLVPGATTVLDVMSKPALLPWANRIGLEGIKLNEYVDHLADIGTCAHAMAAHILGAEPPELDSFTADQIAAAGNCLDSFHEWYDQHEVVPILVEAQLVSELYGYGGTIDFYGYIDGVLTLLDLKTGSGPWPSHKAQVMGAYVHLLEENGHKVDAFKILMIPRGEDESFSEHILKTSERPRYQEIFLLCLKLYNAKKGLRWT